MGNPNRCRFGRARVGGAGFVAVELVGLDVVHRGRGHPLSLLVGGHETIGVAQTTHESVAQAICEDALEFPRGGKLNDATSVWGAMRPLLAADRDQKTIVGHGHDAVGEGARFGALHPRIGDQFVEVGIAVFILINESRQPESTEHEDLLSSHQDGLRIEKATGDPTNRYGLRVG